VNWKELKIESEQLFEFRQVVGGHALQGAVDSVAEFAEAGVVTVVQTLLLGELPEPFDEVEMEL
jgi:riboflavin synthase alpha subunit